MLYVVVIHPLVTHFSVTHFIPSLRMSVTQILLRVFYVGRYAVTLLCSDAFYTQPTRHQESKTLWH